MVQSLFGLGRAVTMRKKHGMSGLQDSMESETSGGMVQKDCFSKASFLFDAS